MDNTLMKSFIIRAITYFLVLSFFLQSIGINTQTIFASEGETIYIQAKPGENGAVLNGMKIELEATTIVKDGRTIVKINPSLFESIGANYQIIEKVNYNLIRIKNKPLKIELVLIRLGNKITLNRNNVLVKIKPFPFVSENNIMVPIGEFYKLLGYNVVWGLKPEVVKEEEKIIEEKIEKKEEKIEKTVPVSEKLRLAIPVFVNRKYPKSEIGKEIQMKLITILSKSEKFTIIDRDEIEKVMREQMLGISGFLDPNTAVKIGKLVGAKVIMMGEIKEDEEKLTIMAKIIDVETAEIKQAEDLEGKKEQLNEMIQVLANRFSPIEGKIILVEDNKIVIDKGQENGVIEGLRFIVFSEKPLTEIEKIEKEIGEIEIIGVQDKVSTAKQVKKTKDKIKVGQKVKTKTRLEIKEKKKITKTGKKKKRTYLILGGLTVIITTILAIKGEGKKAEPEEEVPPPPLPPGYRF